MFVTGRMRDENDIYNIQKKLSSQSFVIVYSELAGLKNVRKRFSN